MLRIRTELYGCVKRAGRAPEKLLLADPAAPAPLTEVAAEADMEAGEGELPGSCPDVLVSGAGAPGGWVGGYTNWGLTGLAAAAAAAAADLGDRAPAIACASSTDGGCADAGVLAAADADPGLPGGFRMPESDKCGWV
jgi:hypothetical protein